MSVRLRSLLFVVVVVALLACSGCRARRPGELHAAGGRWVAGADVLIATADSEYRGASLAAGVAPSGRCYVSTTVARVMCGPVRWPGTSSPGDWLAMRLSFDAPGSWVRATLPDTAQEGTVLGPGERLIRTDGRMVGPVAHPGSGPLGYVESAGGPDDAKVGIGVLGGVAAALAVAAMAVLAVVYRARCPSCRRGGVGPPPSSADGPLAAGSSCSPSVVPGAMSTCVNVRKSIRFLDMRTEMRTATAVRAKVDRARPGTFIRATDFDGTRSATDAALSRLNASRPDLVRVSRGLYWKGVKSRYGAGKPSPVEVARAVTGGRGVGPAGWSAAHALGLSTQIAATPELVIVGAVPTGITDVRFHRRNNTARVGLSYLDIALLEVLRDDLRYTDGGWDSLTSRVRELTDKAKLCPNRVAGAVSAERSPAARSNFARLRTALQAA